MLCDEVATLVVKGKAANNVCSCVSCVSEARDDDEGGWCVQCVCAPKHRCDV